MPLAIGTDIVSRALVATLLLAALVIEAGSSGSWAAALIGLVAPDLALAGGAGRGLAPGQIHRRAVGAYNAVHRWWPPLALLAVAAVTGPPALLAGSLAWAAHVAVDRACGYGLRDADGFQR